MRATASCRGERRRSGRRSSPSGGVSRIRRHVGAAGPRDAGRSAPAPLTSRSPPRRHRGRMMIPAANGHAQTCGRSRRDAEDPPRLRRRRAGPAGGGPGDGRARPGDLARDGVVYAEVRGAPERLLENGLSLDEVVKATVEGFRLGEADAENEGFKIRVEYLICGMRHDIHSQASAELVPKYKGKGVVGFDIAGPEAGFPPTNQLETLSISLSLTTSIMNSSPTESNESIKTNAPQNYYTRNRMITGEDYNINPLTVNHQILKVKSVNRTSSGISRYFDVIDPTSKYSSTRLFSDDGVIYSEYFSNSVNFSYNTRTDVDNAIYNILLPILKNDGLKNFYHTNFINQVLNSGKTITWTQVSNDIQSSTGTFSV